MQSTDNNKTQLMKDRVRHLRKNMTDAENRVWYFLRNRQFCHYKFVRQQIIGSYIVDFVCRRKKVIVELDGGQHAEAVSYDEKRTKFLESKGYVVFRVWNNEVFENIEGATDALLELLEKR